jgi:hypothetical protein
MFATAMMLVATVVGFIKSASAMELITQEEAKLPDGISGSRGITLGPLIILVSPPAAAGMIKSPLNLKIKFESRGGVKVDEDSVVLTYQKNPPIDLTQRSRSFISIHGINIENATVPAGTHSIRVDVKDVQGRSNFLEFGFTITR